MVECIYLDIDTRSIRNKVAIKSEFEQTHQTLRQSLNNRQAILLEKLKNLENTKRVTLQNALNTLNEQQLNAQQVKYDSIGCF